MIYQVVAQRGVPGNLAPVYLLLDEATAKAEPLKRRACILDAEAKQLYPEQSLSSLLKWGYWQQPASGTPPVETLLDGVKEMTSLLRPG